MAFGQSEGTVQSDFIRAPVAGKIACKAVSAVADASGLDLATVGDVGSSNFGTNNRPTLTDGTGPGCVGHYASFYADGADVYVIFGATQAAVTGANVPVIATNGVNATGVAWKIAKDTFQPFKINPDTRWVGFIGSGAGQLRIAKSSI